MLFTRISSWIKTKVKRKDVSVHICACIVLVKLLQMRILPSTGTCDIIIHSVLHLNYLQFYNAPTCYKWIMRGLWRHLIKKLSFAIYLTKVDVKRNIFWDMKQIMSLSMSEQWWMENVCVGYMTFCYLFCSKATVHCDRKKDVSRIGRSIILLINSEKKKILVFTGVTFIKIWIYSIISDDKNLTSNYFSLTSSHRYPLLA